MSDEPPGIASWKENTTAFDRVVSIVETLTEPQTAPYIADEAAVAENTARSHLNRLVDLNVVLKDDDGTTTYYPDPLVLHAQQVRDLLDEYTHDELLERRADLQAELEEFLDEYGGGAAALRERAAAANTADETRRLTKAASTWETLTFELRLVGDALDVYDEYSREALPNA